MQIKRGVAWAGRQAARLLFPPGCPSCQVIVVAPGTLCADCWPKLRFIEQPWCAVLGTPFDHEVGEGAISPAAIADPPAFDRARSAVYYSGPARDLIQRLKYQDRTDLAPWLARWMLRPGQELLVDADLVMPVPLHWRRLVSRRFNQSAELARHLSHFSKRPLSTSLLARKKPTTPQVGLTASQRRDNVGGAFVVRAKDKKPLAGQKILLVDDVFTTGATVSACAQVLKRHGAARVDVLTFARVLGDGFAVGETDAI